MPLGFYNCEGFYTTATFTIFHLKDCRFCRGKWRVITKQMARQIYYTPCEFCFPEMFETSTARAAVPGGQAGSRPQVSAAPKTKRKQTRSNAKKTKTNESADYLLGDNYWVEEWATQLKSQWGAQSEEQQNITRSTRGESFIQVTNEYEGWSDGTQKPSKYAVTGCVAFVAKRGTCFHRPWCKRLSRTQSSDIVEMSVDYALWLGYESCATCNADDL